MYLLQLRTGVGNIYWPRTVFTTPGERPNFKTQVHYYKSYSLSFTPQNELYRFSLKIIRWDAKTNFCIPSQQRWRWYSNAAVSLWMGECASLCVYVRHTLPCGHYSDYSFCPITFKLHMQVVGDDWWVEEPYWFRATE